MAKKKPRKKLPKELAVINADNCTGCESCLEVCPVDCIELKTRELGVKGSQSWCEIDIERCVGCEVCVHIPQKKSNPYELLVCPWDAIEMVPTEQVAQVVAQIGGPPDYIAENWDRLVGTAQHLAELKASGEPQVIIDAAPEVVLDQFNLAGCPPEGAGRMAFRSAMVEATEGSTSEFADRKWSQTETRRRQLTGFGRVIHVGRNKVANSAAGTGKRID